MEQKKESLSLSLTWRTLVRGMSSYAAAGIPGGGAAAIGAAAGAAAAATAAAGGPAAANISTSLLVTRSSAPVPFTICTHHKDQAIKHIGTSGTFKSKLELNYSLQGPQGQRPSDSRWTV